MSGLLSEVEIAPGTLICDFCGRFTSAATGARVWEDSSPEDPIVAYVVGCAACSRAGDKEGPV